MSPRSAPSPRAVACCLLLVAAGVRADAAVPLEKGLDQREPPFGEFDYSWLNSNNRQPATLLSLGPVDFALYTEVYFLFQFHQPVDHTAFPGTAAPRHNELSVNLAFIGFDLNRLQNATRWGGPIGRIYLQYGTNVETDAGQDTTTQRGFFLTNRAFQFLQQASVGWHFPALHGVNVELGVFPSYFGPESYIPQENWSYLHAFAADFTPYYFVGLRAQFYPTQRFRLELWLVNGWQTYGQWHEARAGGYAFNWRPRQWLSWYQGFYVGQDVRGDSGSLRLYFDNNWQVQLHRGGRVQSVALSFEYGLGYDRRTLPTLPPSGVMTGGSLSLRAEWTAMWATTIRGDLYYDQQQSVVATLPLGSPYALPDACAPASVSGPTRPDCAFLGGGATGTLDFLPSPWVLFRLEYMHREANLRYFAGSRGITGPGGALPTTPEAQAAFTPDLRKNDDRVVLSATLRL